MLALARRARRVPTPSARRHASSAANAYRILGCARGASPEELKRAFRRAALKLHPDHGGDREAFRELVAAFEEATAAAAAAAAGPGAARFAPPRRCLLYTSPSPRD